MHVRITGLSQEMSFEDGSAVNCLLIELPNKRRIRAAVDDDTAMQVTELFMRHGGAAAQSALASVGDAVSVPSASGSYFGRVVPPAEQPMPSRQYAPHELMDNGDGVLEFGGNLPSDEQVRASEQALSQPAMPVGVSGARIHQAVEVTSKKPPKLLVQADEGGNPVLRGAGLVDPADLVRGNGVGDEPGEVGQL